VALSLPSRRDIPIHTLSLSLERITLMLTRMLLCATLAAAFIVPLRADDKPNTAVVPAEKDPRRHTGFLADIKKMDGKIDVVFLGDSITDGWRGKTAWKEHIQPLNALNLGIGGDRTQHVLWRIQHDELKGYSPKAFVIMIGTNNMGNAMREFAGGNTEEEIAAGNKAVVEEIQKQHPDAKILLLGIFPRGAEATNPYRGKVKKTNELIAKLDGKNVKYLDIGEKFLEKDGSLSKEIMPDFLHLSQKGYTIWAEAIEKDLKEMLK
jgi:lysophospholipase L1-like esterase